MLEWLRHVPKFSLVGGLALGLLVLSFAFTVVRLQDVSRSNCQQIEVVKARIRVVISSSLVTLGTPGSAGYSYYAAHPAELSRARAALRQEIAVFAPRSCS